MLCRNLAIESRMTSSITHGRAEDCYADWPDPDIIFSDGPYGLHMYEEDRTNGQEMADWYRPHAEAWAARSSPSTVLLFCGREISWANMHPVLAEHGWVYRQLLIWDKGKGHIAGRVNSKTARTWPIVTEVVGFYARPPLFYGIHSMREAQDYMRSEWVRSGLPLSESNAACGVKNAATRKYLTMCHLWYPPPRDVLKKLVVYANKHGDPNGRPYFSKISGYQDDWTDYSTTDCRDWYRFELPFGQTNVFSVPHTPKPRHPNEKPDELVRNMLSPFVKAGGILWEPFGGTCTASRAAVSMGMNAYAAEVDEDYYLIAKAANEAVGPTAVKQKEMK